VTLASKNRSCRERSLREKETRIKRGHLVSLKSAKDEKRYTGLDTRKQRSIPCTVFIIFERLDLLLFLHEKRRPDHN
jgi:hypothetical protein